MKAISLWQPWSILWALGEKLNETRHWNTNYRGELAIHAAKRCVKSELAEYWQNDYFRTALHKHTMGTSDLAQYLDFGSIVGIVDLFDCKRVEDIVAQLSEKEQAFGNYSAGRFAWMGRNHTKITTSVQTRGFQGFWDLPADVEVKVREQLTGKEFQA